MSLGDLFYWMRRGTEYTRKAAKRGRKQVTKRLRVSQLETRQLLSGFWTAVVNPSPDPNGSQGMMLLSDGSVMVQGATQTVVNGNGTTTYTESSAWYKLTPDQNGNYSDGTWSTLASNTDTGRRFFASNVLPDGRVLVFGGEYSGTQTVTTTSPPTPPPQTALNTGQIYDPVHNTWTSITLFPELNFGDDPSEVVQNGSGPAQVLFGSIGSSNTYTYDPAQDPLLGAPSGSYPWSKPIPKVSHVVNGTSYVDSNSDEESWMKLPDGSILSYDISASANAGTFLAERYQPWTNTWVDASTTSQTNPPGLLSNGLGVNVKGEIGPGLLLPNGNAIFFGGTGNVAIYNPSTGVWSAGQTMPTDSSGNQLVAADAPGAMLPNGKILVGMSSIKNVDGGGPCYFYEYDPTTNTWDTSTVQPASSFTGGNSWTMNMLMLPNGQVLLGNESTQFQVYTMDPTTTWQSSWQPTVTNISRNASGNYTLTGTQLNGMSEGAAYGDDAEMSSNYPIVRFFDIHSTAYYARTYNWSSTGVQTSGTPETTQFANAPSPGVYVVQSVANGIPSNSVLDVLTDAAHNNITLQLDPANSAWLQILNNGSVWSEWPLGLFSSVVVTEDSANTTVSVRNVPTNVTVNEGSGSDTTDIQSVAQFHIDTVYGNGNDVATVGNNGSMQSIQGGVQFLYGLGPVNAVFDDSRDPATHTTTPIQISNSYISGMTPDFIGFTTTSFYGLTVLTGTGTNDIDILGTNAGFTTYVHCNGIDTVTFGGASNGAQSLAGAVYLDEASGNPMTVNVDDSENSAAVPGTVYVTSGGITGLAPGAIQWNSQEVGYLTITSNGLGTTFQVESTPTATLGFFTFGTTTLVGNGPDTVTVGDTSHTVQGIQGLGLYIDNQASFTSVTVDDSGDTGQHTDVTVSRDSSTPGITYEEIGNFAPANIELEAGSNGYGVSGTTILGGTAAGGNSYQVYDTPAATLLKTGAGDLVEVYGTSSSLFIDGNGADNTVVIGNAGLLTTITGQVIVENENPGTTALTIDDSADPNNHVTVPVTISSTSITGLAPPTIYYGGTSLSALNVDVGYNNPNYGNGAPATQSIYDILSTPSLTTTTTLISGGLDTVNVSNAGSMAGIRGSLYLYNIQATSTVTHDTVLLDDSQNTTAHTFVGLDQAVGQFGNVYQEISFLAPGFIYLADPDVQSARVQFGTPASGTNAVTVTNTAPDVAMTLVGTGVANNVAISGNTSGLTVEGFSSVGIGNSGSVASINGGINATGDGAVTVDDSKDPNVRSVTVANGTVDNGLNPAAAVSPWLQYSSLASLTIDAGTPAVNGVPTGAGNTFTVNSTAATPFGTTLNVGGGAATVTVSDTANTLDGIQGSLAINGQGKATLTFNDEGTATVQAYNIYANQVMRLVGNTPDMAPVSYAGVSHLIVHSGTGGTENILGVVSTAPGTTLDFYNHGYEGIFALDGLDNTMNGIQGPVHLHSDSIADLAEFVDEGNTVGQTYTLTASTLTRTGMAPVTFDPMGQVILAAAENASTASKINLRAVAAGTYAEFVLGTNTTLTVGSQAPALGGTLATILGPVLAEGGTASTGTVILDDSGDMNAEHATLAPDGTSGYDLTNLTANPIYLVQVGKTTLDAGKGTNTFTVQGLPQATTLTINGGTGSNTLTGPNQPGTWTISGANSGSLGKLKFTHVQNLVGGSASDVFKFSANGSLSGSVNGGGGGDWLDYSAFASTSPVSVNLVSGAATRVAGGVTNIANVRGGAGNDTLIGGGGNILVGGGGNDVLTDLYNGSSASGGSLLIGGLGSDTLTGGSAGDILIGEATSYDTKNANLQDILKEWDTASSHAAAFAVLQGTGAGATKSKLIWGTTVKDDSAADVLMGATSPADADWFFAGASDSTNARHGLDYLNNGLA